MKRAKRPTLKEKKQKFKTIRNWVEDKRKRKAQELNSSLKSIALDNDV